MLARLAVAAMASSTVLLSQGLVPPYQLGQSNPLTGLSTPAVPGSNVQQVHMIHLPGDPPNVYLCALTVSGLSGNGGVGGTDLLTGSYDVLTDTFTPNSEAAALNTGGTEFGMMLHHSGLYAAFDRLPGPPQFAMRPAIGQPWQPVGTISPLPTQSYYDPALADYNGQTWLLHVLGNDIAMTPIDLTNGTLTGSSVVIVRGARSGSTANSPTPVVDASGQLIGLSHHDLAGSDNDHYMSLDLDPNTPSVLMNDTTTWTNNGAFVGGRFFDAEFTPSPYHVFSIDTFWFTGGRAPIGGTMSIDIYSPPTTSMETYLSTVVISPSFSAAPAPFPPATGLLGLTPVNAVTIGFVLHDNRNGTARISFPIPNSQSLRGTSLPAQSATIATLAVQVTLGNTALLRVD